MDKKCIIIVDDLPEKDEKMIAFIGFLERAANERQVDVVFQFVQAMEGFTEPFTVYSILAHTAKSLAEENQVAGLILDCYSRKKNELDSGGEQLAQILRGITNRRQDAQHFEHAIKSILGSIPPVFSATETNFCKETLAHLKKCPIVFYTNTYKQFSYKIDNSKTIPKDGLKRAKEILEFLVPTIPR